MNIRSIVHAWINKAMYGYTVALEAVNLTRSNKMSMQVLTNKLNPNNPDKTISVDELELLSDLFSLHIPLAEYHAHKANAVVVQLPELDESAGDMNMLEAFMHASVTAGDFAREFTDAWSDGRITPVEFARMREKLNRQIACQLGLLAKIEQVVG